MTDEELLRLADTPELEHLKVSGPVTDRGLAVLRELPELRTFTMTWQPGISDAGTANLKFCEKLESVNLMGTSTGDATVAALRGKVNLRRFESGKLVTDVGLAMLHDFAKFANGPGDEGTRLLIDGPFTNRGLASLAGLEGVCDLDLFWHATEITTDGYGVLKELPNLQALGCDGALCDDRAMLVISALPKLRKLRAQGSAMTDEGYVALSGSATIEDFWGREALHLTGRGFAALAEMPSLKKLGVSCKHVEDEAMSLLPGFPALRELTTIDIEDDGFRYVGQCERLERVACMYCRETTDAATEHIRNLRLTSYYAGKTKITDKSLEVLSGMDSLELVELWECDGITEAGLRILKRLPHLREVKCKLSSEN